MVNARQNSSYKQTQTGMTIAVRNISFLRKRCEKINSKITLKEIEYSEMRKSFPMKSQTITKNLT